MSASIDRIEVSGVQQVEVMERERDALGLRRVRSTEFCPIVRYLRATKPPSARSEVKRIPKREARESRIRWPTLDNLSPRTTFRLEMKGTSSPMSRGREG